MIAPSSNNRFIVRPVMLALFATVNVRRKYVVMKWFPTGPPFTSVASSFSCPSLYPSCAGPDAHVESLNAVARHAVPWFDPSSLYFHTAPAPISDAVFVDAPAPDRLHAPVRALSVAGSPLTNTDLVVVVFAKPLNDALGAL